MNAKPLLSQTGRCCTCTDTAYFYGGKHQIIVQCPFESFSQYADIVCIEALIFFVNGYADALLACDRAQVRLNLGKYKGALADCVAALRLDPR